MMPITGVTENGVVGLHPGFLPPGSGGVGRAVSDRTGKQYLVQAYKRHR